MARTRHIPEPVEEHVWDIVLGTEVDVLHSRLCGEGGAAHDLSRPHPFLRILDSAWRIEILHYVVVFNQLRRTVGRHYDLPGSGVVCHYVYRRVHHRFERSLMPFAMAELREAPVIIVRVKNGHPLSAGQLHRQCAFHRYGYAVDRLMHEWSLSPLLAPGHRSFGQSEVGEVVDHLMKDCGRMLREEIAESDALVVGTHLHVKAIVAFVLARHMQGSLIVSVAYCGAFSIKGCPYSIHGCTDADTVYSQHIHPRFRLSEVAFAESHLPGAVVHLHTGP